MGILSSYIRHPLSLWVQMCINSLLSPIVAALNGGEDYELLFTIKQEDYQKFQSTPGPEIYAIGYVCDKDKGRRLITTGGDEAELQAQGWRFFSSNTSDK